MKIRNFKDLNIKTRRKMAQACFDTRSREQVLFAIAREQYETGVPSTVAPKVARNILDKLLKMTSTHVALPGDQMSYYAHAAEAFKLWSSEDAQEYVRRSTQSFCDRHAA